MKKTKLLIIGNKSMRLYSYVSKHIDQFVEEHKIIKPTVFNAFLNNGDRMAARWAIDRGLPFSMFKSPHGSASIRNYEMLQHATHVLIFWDDERNSKITKDLLFWCDKDKIKYKVIRKNE